MRLRRPWRAWRWSTSMRRPPAHDVANEELTGSLPLCSHGAQDRASRGQVQAAREVGSRKIASRVAIQFQGASSWSYMVYSYE
ncbi:hypothetical protein U9M48_003907 [Paspalum notatum var. saurae]|uniref:Uncharacterized protein n=1 Tax=Paspalum notatum var. saurae TaxID=547442 RepID=A0AAQ3SIK1_PASNO